MLRICELISKNVGKFPKHFTNMNIKAFYITPSPLYYENEYLRSKLPSSPVHFPSNSDVWLWICTKDVAAFLCLSHVIRSCHYLPGLLPYTLKQEMISVIYTSTIWHLCTPMYIYDMAFNSCFLSPWHRLTMLRCEHYILFSTGKTSTEYYFLTI